MSDNPFNVLMDLNDNNEFEKPDEDLTDYLAGDEPIVWERGKNQSKQFASVQAGVFDTRLKNHTRRFSPFNTESDLNEKLEPGHLIQIQTKPVAGAGFAFADGTGFAFADGTGFAFNGVAGRVVGTFISDGFPQSARWEDAKAGMPGKGVISRLVGTTLTTTLHLNISTSAALHLLLDEAGWPEDKRIIEEGLTNLAVWSLNGEDGFRGVERIVQTEGPGADWGEDADGNFYFRNRDSLTTNPRSTMSQATLSDTDWQVQDLSIEQNYQNVIKASRVTIEEKEPQPLQEIWNHGGELVLAANEEIVLEIRGSGLFLNAQTPSPVASNTIWKFEGDQALVEGTFKGKYLGQITAGALAYNATASDFQDEFEALSTIMPGNISFSGGPLNVAAIYGELIGDFAGLSITELPEIVESTLNPMPIPGAINVREVRKGGLQYEIQALEPTGKLIAGTWSADIETSGGSGSTNDLPYDAPAEEIAQEFRDIPLLGLTGTDGAGGPLDQSPVIIDFADLFEDIPDLVIHQTGIMMESPSATVNVEVSTPGGVPDYVETAGELDFIELESFSGSVAPLRIKAGPDGVTLSVRVRAQPLEVVRSQQVTYPPDTMLPPSKIDTPDILPDISLEDARRLTQERVLYYEKHRPSFLARHETSTDDPEGMDAIFQLREQDKVKLENYQLGLNHYAHIQKLKYEYDPANFLLVTYAGVELAT